MPTIAEKLVDARRELLDLSARNRLIHTPRGATRTGQLEITEELSAEVFRRLVEESKSMTFRAMPDPDDETKEREPLTADDDSFSYSTLDEAQKDEHLQTKLTAEPLQTRLLKLFYDARTFEEEQGVNILYLVLGFLKWYEAANSEEVRYAPLLLIPVELSRTSVRSRFRLAWTGDDITTNLSLQEKLQGEFAAKLPPVPEVDELKVSEYFSAVRTAVSAHRRWEVVDNDITLGFFSFAKFLMFRDLHPETWPSEQPITKHPLTNALLTDGFHPEPSLFGTDDKIDQALKPHDLLHVVDADRPRRRQCARQSRGLAMP